MADEIPEQLGDRYRIDRLIAEGGMARVYRGTDTVLGRTVAIKILSARLAPDPSFVARFEREAQSVAALNHPNLVGVYDIGADGDLHYIVMEHVEGSTLDAVIRQEAPMPAGRVTAIAASICEGLAMAHAKGIVHRDIKPANVMIEPTGRVKVMDFGIAKTKTEGLTQVGAVLGTVKYLAPEQAHGLQVDARTDIYALGCVMYEMLTGRPPIEGDSLIEIARKLTSQDPPPPSSLNPGVPPDLERVVMRALAKDPEDRYANTEAMIMDLGHPGGAGAADPAAAVASSPTIVQERPDRTRVLEPALPPARPTGRLGLLIVGLALVAGGAVALVRNLSAPEPAPPAAPPAVPAETGSPTPTPTPTPTESPSPAPSPSPTPTEANEGNAALIRELRSAAEGVQSVLAAAVGEGTATERAARNIVDEAEKPIAEAERGDLDDALGDLEDAREEVQKYLDREEVTAQVAANVNAQLDRMAEALGS